MNKRIINIILLVICMICIFLFSSESADDSTKTSIETTKKVVNVVSNDKVDNITSDKIAKDYFNEIRKSAHVIEYFCLGILAINVLKDYHKINIWMILICIVFCMLYALSDEIHQIYVPGRSCEYRDVLIDSVGGIFGIMIYYIFKRKQLVSN